MENDIAASTSKVGKPSRERIFTSVIVNNDI